jgi:hypothetical protein
MELSDLADSGLTVSLSDAMPVNEGEVIEFCPTDGKIYVVYSRASGGLDVDPPAPAYLNFEPLDSCDDPASDPDTGAEGGAVPGCVVGSWLVAELPQMPGAPASELSGEARLTVDRDGNMVTQYTNFTQTMQIQDLGPAALTVNGTIRNKIAIEADGTVSDVGDYALEGISATMAMGGMSLDATDIFMAMLSTSFGLPANSIVTCIDANTLSVDIMAGSTAARVLYTRG